MIRWILNALGLRIHKKVVMIISRKGLINFLDGLNDIRQKKIIMPGAKIEMNGNVLEGDSLTIYITENQV